MPGQVRGLSWFAPVLLRLRDLDETSDAQIMRQKVGAMLAGIVFDGGGQAMAFPGKPKGDGVVESGLEPGTLKVLNVPGDNIHFTNPPRIGAESIEFMKLTAREIAAGLGVPYEMLTGDLSQTNYSSIRAGTIDFRRRVEMVQHHVLVFQFCRPTWRRFITTEILSGRLPAPGFERDPEPYLAARWITPRTEWVDPKKDVDSEVAELAARLTSRSRAVAARGIDIEELDAEIAADEQREQRLALTAPSEMTQ
jgi:lambda family phage portal protein